MAIYSDCMVWRKSARLCEPRNLKRNLPIATIAAIGLCMSRLKHRQCHGRQNAPDALPVFNDTVIPFR